MRLVRGFLAAALALAIGACATTPKGLDFEGVRLDPKGQIAPDLLTEALASYTRHRGTVPAQTQIFELPNRTIESRISPIRTDMIGVIDFRLPSNAKRFFLVDLDTGAVEAVRVAHGAGSGRGAYASVFSNRMDTLTSSVGAYLAANQYDDGRWPGSVRLHGLDATNSCAFWRAIVMHEAAYMTPQDGRGTVGNSDGCLALSMADRPRITARVRDGAFLYAGPAGLHTRTHADGLSSQSACEAVRARPELGPQTTPDSAEPEPGF
jgi:hypothetical protein